MIAAIMTLALIALTALAPLLGTDSREIATYDEREGARCSLRCPA